MALLDFDRTPSVAKLRWFFGAWIVFFGLMAWLIARKLGASHWGTVLTCVVASAGVGGLLFPLTFRPAYLAWMYVTYPIGWVISWVLLGVTFFGVFTPVGLMMRMLGRDPMSRKFDRSAGSYWVKRSGPVRAERYFRQF